MLQSIINCIVKDNCYAMRCGAAGIQLRGQLGLVVADMKEIYEFCTDPKGK